MFPSLRANVACYTMRLELCEVDAPAVALLNCFQTSFERDWLRKNMASSSSMVRRGAVGGG